MHPLTKPLAAVVLALSITAGPGVSAAADKSPEEMAVEGVGRILEAMKLFIDTLPMYAAPEILPNGDIIIRRLNPPERGGQVPEHAPRDDERTET